jgi:TonB family protein
MILVFVGAAAAQNSGTASLAFASSPRRPFTQAHGDSVVEPVPLRRCQQPQFTPEALLAHLAGTVTMSFTVDDDGNAKDIHVVNPLGLGLDESAVACMGQSRYSPARKDGKPVPLKMNISLAFQDHADSDWHLGKIAFQTPEGASRPIFLKANYPQPSAGKRAATTCIHLTVDKSGLPAGVEVSAAQDPSLDKEALAIARSFRFQAASRNGQPVEVPTILNLVHTPPNRVAAK